MTPHISAEKNQIAKIVLMPGDPLRAKFIAENYLEEAKLVSSVRNVYIYTGFFKGKRISVAASGMGTGSIGIYAYELFKFYDVEKIVRIGSAGSYREDLKVHEILVAEEAISDSCAFAQLMLNKKKHLIHSDKDLVAELLSIANKKGINVSLERVHSTDAFYSQRPLEQTIELTKASAVEMESFALFVVAKLLNKKAASLLTVSDNLITKEELNPLERQNGFTKMMEIALEIK
ncbi:purine-nucleoside phosphorylase [Mesomycoplasma hyorhinis]|uniref:purine-nucleoside phosphorylase n=1 Tax=Mesomycoplasma hyorhinis TaxID=2100 RepID=UPI00035D140D|nr:purine-nucleoside phosphorylase [Mesomycoplasma hyorhinis]QPC29539.1 purine-nucleoside phosphorylase [Mesomycoplasma hyorhinis]SYV92023.1 purine-nucleoside phosphorylase [Mesomycoplasma hyorhinis]